jgi:aromatic ring-opening dioxygenase LigB subunit
VAGDKEIEKTGVVNMIQRAYLLPHPPLALPGIGRGGEREISATLAAMDEAAKEIAALAPQTIIFISPHATVFGDYFHISPGEGADGNFARFGAADIQLDVRYNGALAAEITRLAGERSIPAGSDGERDPSLDHGVMVPLWYIKQRYTNFNIVRISPSGLDAEAHYRMGQCIAHACEAPAVLIASGDLSHKLLDRGPYGFAPEGPEFDQAVCKAFRAGDFQLFFDDAYALRKEAAECGLSPLMMLVGCFHRTPMHTRLLSYEGPFGVGYAVGEVKICPYRTLAKHALESRVTGSPASLPPWLPPEMLERQAGVFVSLHINGQLRDPRFNPVTREELPHLTYKVDLLAAAEPISGAEELDVHRYGVIVTYGVRRGLLLPNLESITTVQQQIAIACQKAGINENDPYEMERFEVVRYA